MDHEDEMDHEGHAHVHSTLREFVEASSPKLNVKVTADPVSGVNVRVTSDRQVEPSAASSDHVDG